MHAFDLYRELTHYGVDLRIDQEGFIEVRGELKDSDRVALRDHRAEFLRIIEREQRRATVLAMMADAPESRSRFWVTDTQKHPDFVILTFAIRGAGSGELSIPREKYDAFKVAEMLAELAESN